LIARAVKKRDQIQAADLSRLADPTWMGPVPHPSISDKVSPRFDYNRDTGLFSFMGRSALKTLVDGVQNAKQSSINVLGTKFFGKSHLTAAYVAQRLQACYKREANALPILFLAKCGDLAELDDVYLKDAMLLAFAADGEVLAEIAGLQKDTKTLLDWLDNKAFDVAVDQRNDIEEERMMHVSNSQITEAKNTLLQLKKITASHRCTMLSGYSANNDIIKTKFYKERTESDVLFYGGLEEKVRFSLPACVTVIFELRLLTHAPPSIHAGGVRSVAGALQGVVARVERRAEGRPRGHHGARAGPPQDVSGARRE
jgi:hypothetical protein